jgi:hypothetical protein
MAFKEKTPTKITFDESMLNTPITGKIASVGRAGRLEVNTYTMLTENNEIISFLGNTVLDKVLADELDSLVRITYTGEVKSSGGFKVKQFKVEVWEDNEPETETVLEPTTEQTVKSKKK